MYNPNIDSYANKIGDFKSYLSTMKEASTPHIIALTEVNAKNYTFAQQESELQPRGYNQYSTGIGVKPCRGILVYVHFSLHATQLEFSKFVENVIVSIKLEDQTVNVCTIYRSPNSDLSNDYELVQLIDWFVWCLTARQHRRGQFVPTAGG